MSSSNSAKLPAIPYDEMTWQERAIAFLNDGRNMIGNSQRQLQEATKPHLNNGVVGPSPMAGVLFTQSQIFAQLGQAYMTGGVLCSMLAGQDISILPPMEVSLDWGKDEVQDSA